MQETQRLYPVAILYPRKATKDTKIGMIIFLELFFKFYRNIKHAAYKQFFRINFIHWWPLRMQSPEGSILIK